MGHDLPTPCFQGRAGVPARAVPRGSQPLRRSQRPWVTGAWDRGGSERGQSSEPSEQKHLTGFYSYTRLR